MGWIRYNIGPGPDTIFKTCEVCGGSGMDGRDIEPTDRAHLAGETPKMAFAGYTPAVGVCECCEGRGGNYWPKRKEGAA